MRNFDEEIKKLEKDVKTLEITTRQKKTQLKKIEEEQREIQNLEKTSTLTSEHTIRDTIRDHYGKEIQVGDWVKVTKKGRFNSIEGTVVRINKWVTFEDSKGVKQVRAPHNLIVNELRTGNHVE